MNIFHKCSECVELLSGFEVYGEYVKSHCLAIYLFRLPLHKLEINVSNSILIALTPTQSRDFI